jgi:hypothetical protein
MFRQLLIPLSGMFRQLLIPPACFFQNVSAIVINRGLVIKVLLLPESLSPSAGPHGPDCNKRPSVFLDAAEEKTESDPGTVP